MELLTLWPLSQGELSSMREGFVDAVFDAAPPVLGPSRLSQQELIARVLEGGFPEVVQRTNASRTRAWFRSYTTTVLQRHVQDIANIDALAELPRILSLVAAQATGLANVARLARDVDIPPTSMKRYLALLQASYVVQAMPGWSQRLGQRLMKTERLTLLDSGVLAYLQNVTAQRLILERQLLGPLLETFVLMEIQKQLGWSETLATLYYLRTHGGIDVDIVIEASDGRMAGIEVRSSTKVEKRDFRGLEFMREAVRRALRPRHPDVHRRTDAPLRRPPLGDAGRCALALGRRAEPGGLSLRTRRKPPWGRPCAAILRVRSRCCLE